MTMPESKNRNENSKNHPSTPARPPAVVVVRRSPRINNQRAIQPACHVTGRRTSPPRSRVCGINFTEEEDELLSDVMETHLPISADQRDLDAAEFCQI